MLTLFVFLGLPTVLFIFLNKIFDIYYIGFKGMVKLYIFCFVVCNMIFLVKCVK